MMHNAITVSGSYWLMPIPSIQEIGPALPSVYILSLPSYGMEYLSGQLGSSVLTLSSPSFYGSPASLLWGGVRSRKGPWLIVNPAQPQLKHQSMCSQYYFLKFKIQHYTSNYKENHNQSNDTVLSILNIWEAILDRSLLVFGIKGKIITV